MSLDAINRETDNLDMLGVFVDTYSSPCEEGKGTLSCLALKILKLSNGEELTSFDASFEGEGEPDVREKLIRIFEENGIRRGEAIFICGDSTKDRRVVERLVPPERRPDWPYHWLDIPSMYFQNQFLKALFNGRATLKELGFPPEGLAGVSGRRDGADTSLLGRVDDLITCFKAVAVDPQELAWSPCESNGTQDRLVGVFLDTETSGLNPGDHRILEIAVRILDLTTGVEISSFESVVYQPHEVMEKASERALEVNGFSEERVQGGIQEPELRERILQIMKESGIRRDNAVFICQNPSFDESFFEQIIPDGPALDLPERWLDLASMHFAKRFQEFRSEKVQSLKEIRFSKDKIAETYQLPPEAKPHRAMNGVDHLILCFQAVTGCATDLPRVESQ